MIFFEEREEKKEDRGWMQEELNVGSGEGGKRYAITCFMMEEFVETWNRAQGDMVMTFKEFCVAREKAVMVGEESYRMNVRSEHGDNLGKVQRLAQQRGDVVKEDEVRCHVQMEESLFKLKNECLQAFRDCLDRFNHRENPEMFSRYCSEYELKECIIKSLSVDNISEDILTTYEIVLEYEPFLPP